MGGGFKSYIENTVYWVILIGTLALIHVVDSNLFDLPKAVTSFADGIPRLVYPLFYGTIALYVLRPFHWEIRQPRKLALILGMLFVVLVALVEFADLPTVGFMNLQYLVGFLLIVLGGVIAACAQAVMTKDHAERARVPETGTLRGALPPDPLCSDLSWMWRRNGDVRNRELMSAVRSSIKLLLLICASGYILFAWQKLSDLVSLNDAPVMELALFTGATWAAVLYGMVSANRKSWAPNIDADSKLRKAFGANYDMLLDRELETKSLRKLFAEDWFIRMHVELTGPASSAKGSAADY